MRTVFAEAAKLTERSFENSFDFVNARAWIDHAHDPFEAVLGRVTDPGWALGR